MGLLDGKVAIITGASSGIGYATAKLFAEEGAKLILCSRREKKLLALANEINSSGGEAIALAGDAKDEVVVKSLVEMALDNFGRLDVAFNNAGTLGTLCAISEMKLSDWHETIDTNLTSAFLGAKYQLPAMKKNGGGLIFVSSFAGYTVGMPNMAAYGASKARLIGLKSLETEFATNSIRVNAL